MHTFANLSPFTPHRIETFDGKEYLVVKGVTIVEGVLNKFFVPMDEFGAFVKDWDGVPIVLRHPKQNNGSARVPVPDVPILGRFFGASLDSANRRLTGEYWLDKAILLSSEEGKQIHDDILEGKIIETSTGYYANIDQIPGKHNGLPYIGVQREIHPDHIAVLPDEAGACSIKDGCGINRNSAAINNCEDCMNNSMLFYNLLSLENATTHPWHKGRKGEVGGSTSEGGGDSAVDKRRGAGTKERAMLDLLEERLKAGKLKPGEKKMIESRIEDLAKKILMMNRADVYADIQNMMNENMPEKMKKMWEEVHKKAKADGDDEETAAKKAWGACKRAGYMKKGEGWVKKNYAIFENAADDPDYSSNSMIAFMLPDTIKEKIKAQFPFMSDEVYDNLHMTLAFLGETSDMDAIQVLKSMFETAEYQPKVAGQVQGLARFISGGEQDAFVLTFDSPGLPLLYKTLSSNLDWKGVKTPSDHGFIPHITIAYIGKDDEIPADTFEPFDMEITDITLVNGDKVFLKVPFYKSGGGYVNSQAPSQPTNWLVNLFPNFNKEKNQMDEIKKLIQTILNNTGWNVSFDDKGKTASVTPAAPALSPTLTGLESVVNEAGGVDKFAALLKSLTDVPASIQALANGIKTIQEGVQAATTMAQNAAAEAEAKKKEVVARLIVNKACPFDEAVLNGMTLGVLEKLDTSYRPTNYAALGGFVNSATNGGEAGDEDILATPSLLLNYAAQEQGKVN